MLNKYKGITFIIIAGLLSASNIIINKIGLTQGLYPLTFATFKMLFAIGILGSIFSRIIQKEIKILCSQIKIIGIMGFIGYGMGPIALYFGQKFTSATNSAFLLQTQPLFVVLFAMILFNEKQGKRGFISILLLLGGAYLVTTSGVKIVPGLGDVLIIFSALFFGIEAVIAKIPLEKLSSGTTVLAGYLVGSLVLISFWSFTLDFPLESDWIWITLSAITIAFCLVCLYQGIKFIGVSYSTMLLCLISVLFTAIFAHIILKESISTIQSIGAIMLVSGVFLLSSEIHKKQYSIAL